MGTAPARRPSRLSTTGCRACCRRPASVAAVVTWADPASGDPHSREITQDDLDLAPIDLLWTVRPAGDATMTDLDDRIIGAVVDRDNPRPDAELTIRYTERIDGKITFFELSPLITALRTLLTTARPLRPTDLVPAAGRPPWTARSTTRCRCPGNDRTRYGTRSTISATTWPTTSTT